MLFPAKMSPSVVASVVLVPLSFRVPFVIPSSVIVWGVVAIITISVVVFSAPVIAVSVIVASSFVIIPVSTFRLVSILSPESFLVRLLLVPERLLLAVLASYTHTGLLCVIVSGIAF